MRNRFTKNEYLIKDNKVFIFMYGREEKGKGQFPNGKFATIDYEDFCKVKDIKLSIDGNGYPQNSKSGYLHHIILGNKKGFVIDHIDGDKTNNCKYNLRTVSHSANHLNNTKKGYYYSNGRYRVCIMYNYKKYSGGSFKNEKDAKKKAVLLRKSLLNKEIGL